MYSISFTVTRKTFCLSLYHNGANSHLFVNAIEIYKFKAKDSKFAVHYVQETFLKTGQQIIWKKTGFNGYVYNFSVDYDANDVDDIKNIDKYLMKKIT